MYLWYNGVKGVKIMIQVREQYGNIYVRILDTGQTFDKTLEKILKIKGRSFKQTTGEWMFGKESLGDLLRHFDNQIIWVQPLQEIVKDMDIDDELVKKHLSWLDDDDFKDWKLKPYPYQRVGAHYLADRGRAALFDGVGLGKTVQILGASQILMNRGKAQRVLVVTLASLKRQWAKEVEKFTNDKALYVYGPPQKRKKIIREFGRRNDIKYLIINYEVLRNEEYRNLIKEIPFDIVALDEAQKIKSGVEDRYLGIKPSQTALGCYDLNHIPYRFIATATPIQSKAEEIWSLFHFVDPNILGPWEVFRERYCKYHPRYGITGSQNLGELYYRISPYFIRRTKECPEVQQQLPKVQHSHIFLEMTDEQIKIENTILAKLEEIREEMKNITGSRINGNLMTPEEIYDGIQQGLITFLVENCDSPMLLAHEESSNMAKQILNQAGVDYKKLKRSPKLENLKEFAMQILNDEPNSKVVIFTEFERMARIIRDELPYSVMYTGQLSEREKQRAVESFRNDPNVKFFVSTSAGSTGLNLQVANYMIHFDMPFTATEIEQRNGRIDRTGNEFSNITIYYYIMSDSYEESMIELLFRKSQMANEILTGQAEKSSSRSQDVAKLAMQRMLRRKSKKVG